MADVEKVFDAGGFPEYTYVDRERRRLEERLEKALDSSTPGVSVIGPSKSGKTVLIQNVAWEQELNLIQIRGPNIDSVEGFWNAVLDELDVPDDFEEHVTESTESGTATTGGVRPQGTGVEHTKNKRETKASGQTRTYSRDGLRDVIDHKRSDEIILLLDDFHYIEERELKKSIAQSIKGAIEEEIRVCVAFVTHRGETLQQLCPDLDSRVMTIRCEQWSEKELKEIIDQGESELNVNFPDWLKEQLAANAIGSPMVMQRLCAAACREGGIEQSQDESSTPVKLDVDRDNFDEIIGEAADWMGKRGVVRKMAGGIHDTGRVEYDYGGNQKNDTYILGLRAIANGSSTRSFRFQDLKDRIREDCVGDHPNPTQIENFCDQIENIAEEERPGENLVEWDTDEKMLLISDPELLFLIRYLMRDDDFEERLLFF